MGLKEKTGWLTTISDQIQYFYYCFGKYILQVYYSESVITFRWKQVKNWLQLLWKLLAAGNIQNAFKQLAETSVSGVILFDELNARIRFLKKTNTRWPKLHFSAKISNFQSRCKQFSTALHLKFLITTESKFHEFSETVIKIVNFDWYGGKPAGFLWLFMLKI